VVFEAQKAQKSANLYFDFVPQKALIATVNAPTAI
jgi:hypothetical protein